PATEQKVKAGFDVSLYAALEKEQLPLFNSEGARKVVKYLESLAQEIQSQVGQRCTVEVIPNADSIVLDPHRDFQPQAMLQTRISHGRGLDQVEGTSEEQALEILREKLHEFGVKEG